MILIADSGSTKTDWCVADSGQIVQQIATQGINPYAQSSDEIIDILRDELVPQLVDLQEIEAVYFYGSGCTQAMIPTVEGVLRMVLRLDNVQVHSDLMGAARALCDNNEGIACILGTGANSCLYDGTQIVMNTPPLGYILGDEGSGAVLGRSLVNALFKGLLSDGLRNKFIAETRLTQVEIIDKVYRQPLPNRFLASLSTFIYRHIDNEELQNLVINNFRLFIRSNIARYNRRDLPLNFIGSIASVYEPQLRKAASIEGFCLGKVERSPMQGLIKYHG